MRVRILSDVHREIHRYRSATETLPAVDCNLVILAGDVDRPLDAVSWAWRNFPDSAVVYIAGNHESYGDDLDRALDEAREAAARTRGHVRFLENDETEIDGWRVLGCTLWTDYCLFDASWQWQAMRAAGLSMNDHRTITLGDRGFRPADALERHESSRLWLTSRLQVGDQSRTIVATHHGVTWQSVAPQWQRDIVSAAFVSDLSDLLLRTQPALWCHGHVHASFDYEIDATRVIANPRGYGSENPDWEPCMVIDLDGQGGSSRSPRREPEEGPPPDRGPSDEQPSLFDRERNIDRLVAHHNDFPGLRAQLEAMTVNRHANGTQVRRPKRTHLLPGDRH